MMGALTNKLIQFSYRPWENYISTTIDYSSFIKSKIRYETAKLVSIRFLPINYWITNLKRFYNYGKSIFDSIYYFNHIKMILLLLKENNNNSLTFDEEEEKKTVDITLTNTIEDNINFSAKKITLKSNNVYNDILLVIDNKYNVKLSNKIDISKEIQQDTILLANTRIELPDLTNQLLYNGELYNHICFSSSSSSFSRTEIPFSNYNLLFCFFYGYINVSNTMVLASFFTKILRLYITNFVQLKPLYMANGLSYTKNSKDNPLNLLSYKKFSLFCRPFFSFNMSLISFIKIQYQKLNSFDYFPFRKLSVNLLHRVIVTILVVNHPTVAVTKI